jgi:hypothetical protein
MDAGPSSSRYMMIVRNIQDYDDQQTLSHRMAAARVISPRRPDHALTP